MKRTSSNRALLRALLPLTVGALLLAPTSAFAKTQFQGGPLSNLNPAGDKIHMALGSFPTNGGLYVLECLNTVVAGKTKENCDTANELWVSTSTGAVNPQGDVALTVTGTVAGTECGTDKCSIFLTYDHTQPADRSEDQLIPISFASGTSLPIKPKDVITALINGKALSTSIPGTLAYRTPVMITASGKSGGGVTFASSTPDCTVIQGLITALKASSACDITASTPATLEFQATTAHYPFLLTAGKQTITIPKSTVKAGTSLQLPSLTNFKTPITYSSPSKNCSIKGSILQALKKGSCLVVATAPAEGTLWSAVTLKKTVKIS